MKETSLKVIFRTGPDDSTIDDREGLGNIWYANFGRVYRYVKNTDSVPLAYGSNVCHPNGNAGTAVTNEVRVPLTANLPLYAGVVMATGGIPVNSYGWIQIQGPNSICLLQLGAAAAVGSFLKPANTSVNLVVDGAAPSTRRTVQLMDVISGAMGAPLPKNVFIMTA